MTVSRKDFIQQAKSIKLIDNMEHRKQSAILFADLNAKSNPRFKRNMFFKACDIPAEIIKEIA